MYDAINKGMKMATGDIIGILNSDDMLDSDDVIESIVQAFEEKNVDSIYGDLEYVDPDDTNKIYRIWKGKPYSRNLFRFGWMPAHPTFILNGCCSKNSADMKVIIIAPRIMNSWPAIFSNTVYLPITFPSLL